MRAPDRPTRSLYLSNAWRYAVLIFVVVGSLGFMMSQEPFGQVPAYHDFADKRAFFGIPNFVDVMTNIPYLLVGLAGITYARESDLLSFRPAWVTMFVGIALVSGGSGYYHWNPNNDTLVWDRLPMTIGFMGLFVALLAEYTHVKAGRYLLVPALLIGFWSVLYWHWFDDLRLYYWVQLVPLLTVPLVVVLFRPNYSHQSLLLVALGFYILAKIAEIYDREVFAISQGLFSGHSLKHILSALGALVILVMLKRRRPLGRLPERQSRGIGQRSTGFEHSSKVATRRSSYGQT